MMFGISEAIREQNRKPLTVEEQARMELSEEARLGYFGNYSNSLLQQLKLSKDNMSERAAVILGERMRAIRKLEANN